MTRSLGKQLRLLLALVLAAGVLAVPSVSRAHIGGFPSVGTDFGNPGPADVTVLRDGDHTFFHPSMMGEGGVHHPVILWGNGTGANPASYDGLLRHFASHGFIVAAANTPNAGSGREMIAGFDKLVAWNAEEGNTFFGMVNTDDAGATGHSQGGGGAINAGAHPNVSTVFPLQPFRGDAEAVTGSALFFAGGNDTLVSPRSVRTAYGNASGIPAAYAELADASHFVPAGDAGAYRYAATAWARLTLMGDEEAKGVFFGPECTLCVADEWTYEVNAAVGAWEPELAPAPGDGDGHEHPPGTPDDHEHPPGTPDDHEHPPGTPDDHGHDDGDHGHVGDGIGDGGAPAPAPPAAEASPWQRFLGWLRSLLRGGAPAPAPTTPTTMPDDGHEHPPGAPDDHDHGDDDHGENAGEGGHGHGGDCTPAPYAATSPVNLDCYEDVTDEQREEAEALVEATLERLPQWNDVARAEAAGFRSIGDGLSGTEHFINWEWLEDDRTFDPDYPESLVFEGRGSNKQLAAAMYMLPTGSTLEEAPNIGGDLIQWHIHDDLCYNADYRTGATPRLAGLTDADGNCRPGTFKGPEVPMIHVWIRPHPCGPFSSLDGVGGGTIREDEEVQCLDHGHGH